MNAVGLVLQAVDFDGRFGDALAAFERRQRDHHLIGGRLDDPGQFTRVGTHAIDAIQPDDGGRGIDGVHHVIERAGKGVNVLAIERGDERPVQPLDDLMGQEVALVLDSP